MNRRSFLADMIKAGVACTFLKGAGRIWKPTYIAPPVRFVEMVLYKPDAINLQELFKTIYDLKRSREAAGHPLIYFSEKHDPLDFTAVGCESKGIYEQMIKVS